MQVKIVYEYLSEDGKWYEGSELFKKENAQAQVDMLAKVSDCYGNKKYRNIAIKPLTMEDKLALRMTMYKTTKLEDYIIEHNMRRDILFRQMEKFIENGSLGDEAILYVNGEKTDNSYPWAAQFEADAKSPIDWVNGIMFEQDLLKKKDKLEIKVVLN